MARIPVYAPVNLGGIGYPCLESIQDYKGIQLFLRQLQWDQELSTDIRIVLSIAQLEPGYVTPILEDTTSKILHIEVGLIQHLRDRLGVMNGKILIEENWHPKLQRDGDQSIMEVVSKLPNIKKGTLLKVNQVQKYLRVITIAEMADFSGKHIPANRFNGRLRAKSTLNWPRQPPPTPEMWNLFRQIFKRAFCLKHMFARITNAVNLDRPLGNWLNTERHINYEWYRTESIIFQRVDNSFQVFKNEDGGIKFTAGGNVRELPPLCHPTDCYLKDSNAYPHFLYQITKVVDDTEQSEEDKEVSTDPLHIKEAERIVAVSDSAMDPATGEATFNWRITTWTKSGLIEKSSFVNGNTNHMTSYRGELYGINDLIKFLGDPKLCNKHVTISCNNEAAVNKLSPTYFELSDLDQAESDLIRNSRQMLSTFRNYEIIWTRGHQDDNTPFEDLPLLAQLNVECDQAAKRHLREGLRPSQPPKITPGSRAALVLNNNIVTTNLEEQINDAIHRPRLMEYVANKFEWTDHQTLHEVNWRTIGRAKKPLKLHESIRISKMLFGWLNVGSQKVKLGQDGQCPCCDHHIEEQLHLYECTHSEMDEIVTSKLAQINTKLVREGITTPVFTAFMNLLWKATGRTPPSTYEITCESTIAAMEAQESLGREAILRGYHHIKWIELLRDTWIPPRRDSDRKQLERRKDPIQQATMLVRCAWDLFEAVWECRNRILHSNESKLTAHNDESLTTDLLDFKRQNTTDLRCCDRYIINKYADDGIIKWRIPRKRSTLTLLIDLRRIYQNELRLEGTGHRDIRDFIIRTARPAPEALVASEGDTNPASKASSTTSTTESMTHVAGSSDSGTIYGTESSLSDFGGL